MFLRHNPLMRTSVSLYHRHRFPAEIISHCVWLCFRFALSFRDVEEMMASRGISLSYETVREWCLKFGQTYANGLRHKSAHPGDRWHLDEVFLRSTDASITCGAQWIRMPTCWIFWSSCSRDKKAAKKFFRKLLKGLRYAPRVIIVTSHFRPGRHLCAAGDYREMMRRRFDAWDVVVDAPAAA